MVKQRISGYIIWADSRWSLMCYPYSTFEFNLQENSAFQKLLKSNIELVERIWSSTRAIIPHITETMTENVKCVVMLWITTLVCHLVLVITLWVRSTSARLDFLTSSSSLSGRESIASAARLACFMASSLVLCIPRLFPRYSRA